MEEVRRLRDRIIGKVNIHLREMEMDTGAMMRGLFPLERMARFSALCGLSTDHALHFRFKDSAMGGSYFLDRCLVQSSLIYKSDLRGDELKRVGDIVKVDGLRNELTRDEEIRVQDSILIKTLVHSYSHDPNEPDVFHIRKTVAMPYANIHGSPVSGCYLGVGATLDLTSAFDSVFGDFSYVQVGELGHRYVGPGRIWISSLRSFDFNYTFDPEVLARYVRHEPGRPPEGIIPEFVMAHEAVFETAFMSSGRAGAAPAWSALSPYAVVRGDCILDRNVFVSQRAYLEDVDLGPGANAQENCFIIKSRLSGYDVTAHGGKIILAELGRKVFVGFNAFIRGQEDNRLKIGDGCIVMPHTIIDADSYLEIPPDTLVWGYLNGPGDLKNHTLPLEQLAKVQGELRMGNMTFHGRGEEFVEAFRGRIEHILMDNGAYFDDEGHPGHAQRSRKILVNVLQPYPEGPRAGMFPDLEITG